MKSRYVWACAGFFLVSGRREEGMRPFHVITAVNNAIHAVHAAMNVRIEQSYAGEKFPLIQPCVVKVELLCEAYDDGDRQ